MKPTMYPQTVISKYMSSKKVEIQYKMPRKHLALKDTELPRSLSGKHSYSDECLPCKNSSMGPSSAKNEVVILSYSYQKSWCTSTKEREEHLNRSKKEKQYGGTVVERREELFQVARVGN